MEVLWSSYGTPRAQQAIIALATGLQKACLGQSAGANRKRVRGCDASKRCAAFDIRASPVKLNQGEGMRVLLALIIGIALGAAGVWYYGTTQGKARMDAAGEQIKDTAKSAGAAIEDKLRVLDLRTNDIKDELTRTGRVIRKKAQEAGQAIADATADARITAAIKAKILADHDLSVLSVSVNTTGGVVTLSGTVPSAEAISKAMLLAMETSGVQEVISTLQVKRSGD